MNDQPTSINLLDTQQHVGRRLAVARRGARISQTNVSRHLGVLQSRVARLETGDRRLQYLEAFQYAELYGRSVEAFRSS